MIDECKVGQKVVTIGGIHGEIIRKGEATADLKMKDGAVIEVNIGAINAVPSDDADKK